uniref:Uncharacterized protein n=1 Tax=Cacopsylla melanoneura TaxID=428564 RepID=A0A8D9B7V7_9HEMI
MKICLHLTLISTVLATYVVHAQTQPNTYLQYDEDALSQLEAVNPSANSEEYKRLTPRRQKQSNNAPISTSNSQTQSKKNLQLDRRRTNFENPNRRPTSSAETQPQTFSSIPQTFASREAPKTLSESNVPRNGAVELKRPAVQEDISSRIQSPEEVNTPQVSNDRILGQRVANHRPQPKIPERPSLPQSVVSNERPESSESQKSPDHRGDAQRYLQRTSGSRRRPGQRQGSGEVETSSPAVSSSEEANIPRRNLQSRTRSRINQNDNSKESGQNSETTPGSSESNGFNESPRKQSNFRNSPRNPEDRKSLRNFNSLENTLSLGAVNGSGPGGPLRHFPSRPSSPRKTLPGAQSLPKPYVGPTGTIIQAAPQTLHHRENLPSVPQDIPSTIETKPEIQTSVEPNPSIGGVEYFTARNIPVEYLTTKNDQIEYSSQANEGKLHIPTQEQPHVYEVTEEMEPPKNPTRRRKNFGKIRNSRNSPASDLPIESLFSTTENSKLHSLLSPVSRYHAKKLKKPTSVPNYIKQNEHDDNKAKYRYELFNEHSHRAQIKSRLKSTNNTAEVSSEENKQTGSSTPSFKFSDNKHGSDIEIVLPASFNLSTHEDFYLPDEASNENKIQSKRQSVKFSTEDPLEQFDLFVSRPLVESINDLSTNDTSTTSMEVESNSSATQPTDGSIETFTESEKNEGESSLVNNNLLFNASESATNSDIDTNQILPVNIIPSINNLLTLSTTTSTTKPKTTASTEPAFLIYGLYPNGTIARKYPNGTVIPETTNITENSPDDEKILNDIISRNTIFKAVNRANNGLLTSVSSVTTTDAPSTSASAVKTTAFSLNVPKDGADL